MNEMTKRQERPPKYQAPGKPADQKIPGWSNEPLDSQDQGPENTTETEFLSDIDEDTYTVDEVEGEDLTSDWVVEAMEGTATDTYTGGITQAGESQDPTTGAMGASRRYGGPTGGDIGGAGAGGGGDFDWDAPDAAQGVDKPITEGDTGLAAKVARENAQEMMEEDMDHEKSKEDTENAS